MRADRRTFLAAAGGSIVAGALGARAQPREVHAPMATPDGPRIRKALKLGMIGVGDSLREKLEAAREAGFEGVELESPNELDIETVLRAKEASGVEIPGVVDSVHWAKPLSHPDPAVRTEGRAALERALRDCKAYGGTTVLLVPGMVNREVSYADAWRRSIREIKRVMPLARELGVRIAIENVWNHFLLSPLEAARYVDEIRGWAEDPGSPRVITPMIGWYLDLGNVVNHGWPEHWIEALGPRLVRLDIKDFSRARRNEEGLWKGFEVLIGEGDVGWARVNEALDRVGYRGWATAEVRGGGLERLRDISARMDRVLNM